MGYKSTREILKVWDAKLCCGYFLYNVKKKNNKEQNIDNDGKKRNGKTGVSQN